MNNRLANEDGMVFPSDDDLNGASVALTRLQDTYNLDTHALAQGEIRGKKYASPLTGINFITYCQIICRSSAII